MFESILRCDGVIQTCDAIFILDGFTHRLGEPGKHLLPERYRAVSAQSSRTERGAQEVSVYSVPLLCHGLFMVGSWLYGLADFHGSLVVTWLIRFSWWFSHTIKQIFMVV